MEKKPTSHFVAGLLISLILIIMFLALYFTGNAFNRGPISWLPTLIFAGGIIYYIIQFSKAKDHNVTFGSCFSYGFKTTAIVAIIMAAFVLIFLLVFPEYKQEFVDSMTAEMEKNSSNLSDEQIEQSLEMMSKFFLVSAVGGGLFMNLVFGAIASLIGAALAKKKPQTPFQNTTTIN